jgi:hypothetical protein
MKKKLSKKGLIISVSVLLFAILALFVYPAIRGNTKAQFDSITQHEIENPTPMKVRGQPYNEILVVFRYFNKIKAGVYNDIGKPFISEEDFSKISTDEIKKELGAAAVIKNGPRFWVMDEITGFYNGSERTIAGHQMNQPGILNLTTDDLKNRTPYSTRQINRKTAYTYYKGEKVYQIITDKGEIYTMQAASREIDKNLSINDLDNLGSRLKMPAGWTYKVTVLQSDVTYKIDGTAYVIQDDFQNSYQKNPSIQ